MTPIIKPITNGHWEDLLNGHHTSPVHEHRCRTCGGGRSSLGLFEAGSSGHGSSSVWKFGGTPREVEFWAKQNDQFTAAHKGVELQYSYFNGQVRRQKIQAALQTRQLPDVMVGFGQDVPELVNFKAIQPLEALAGNKLAGWRGRHGS